MKIDDELLREIEARVYDPCLRESMLETTRCVVKELDEMRMANDVAELVRRRHELEDALLTSIDPYEIPRYFQVLRTFDTTKRFFLDGDEEQDRHRPLGEKGGGGGDGVMKNNELSHQSDGFPAALVPPDNPSSSSWPVNEFEKHRSSFLSAGLRENACLSRKSIMWSIAASLTSVSCTIVTLVVAFVVVPALWC